MRRLVLAVLVAAVLLASCGDGGAAGPEAAPGPEGIAGSEDTTTSAARDSTGAVDGQAEVSEIVDGDTLRVQQDAAPGGEATIRLIGVDTPETRHPDLGVQCYGREATAFLEEVVPEGTPVRLEFDVERTDRYDRTLAYLYREPDGLFVNLHLAEEGYAQASTVPPNVAHADEFVAAQRSARDAGRGLWSACQDQLDLPPPPSESSEAGCDPSYPDVCLPSPPPDLDCGDLPPGTGSIVVLPPDPHGLDGNGDGVAC